MGPEDIRPWVHFFLECAFYLWLLVVGYATLAGLLLGAGYTAWRGYQQDEKEGRK